MKKLIVILFLLAGFNSFGQVSVTKNSFEIAPATTSVVKVTITARRIPTVIDAYLYTPSGNASTVQWSDSGTDMTGTPAVAADKLRPLRIVNGVFWIKLNNSADKIEIFW